MLNTIGKCDTMVLVCSHLSKHRGGAVKARYQKLTMVHLSMAVNGMGPVMVFIIVDLMLTFAFLTFFAVP